MSTNAELSEFFGELNIKLRIEFNEEPSVVGGGLLNKMVGPETQVVSLKLDVSTPDVEPEKSGDDQEFAVVDGNQVPMTYGVDYRPLTADEYETAAFRGSSIRLQSHRSEPVVHQAPNGAFFTVGDLLRAIEETERQARPNSVGFMGGIDVDHIYFDGLHKKDDDVWMTLWGS
ncbi:MAG: hypothetical protein ACRCYU_05535 [Nocardioides sp.]